MGMQATIFAQTVDSNRRAFLHVGMEIVTVRDIAKRAGLHFTTVAQALRNSPKVSAETRARIQNIAREMGYRPNPMVSALMAQQRARQKPRFSTVLAFVAFRKDAPRPESAPHVTDFLRGARAQAEQLGYKVDEFYLYAKGMTARRLAQILRTRGINGLLLGPSLSQHTHLPAPFRDFAMVAHSYSLLRPRLHRVAHDHAGGAYMACRELRKRGFRRIGLVLHESMDRQVNRLWTAGYLAFHQFLPAREQAGCLYFSENAFHAAALKRWVKTSKPDAIISMHAELIEWVQEIPGPRPLLVSLDYNRRWGHCPGIDQNPQAIGAAAVDVLARQLQWNESGVPAEPLTILIDGKWRDGRAEP
jgi:DNA-binding LacI/PurR family transcriptional regulator